MTYEDVMAGYAIVQFVEWGDGRSTSAVPVSWIVDCNGHLMCYFPRKNAVAAIKKSRICSCRLAEVCCEETDF